MTAGRFLVASFLLLNLGDTARTAAQSSTPELSSRDQPYPFQAVSSELSGVDFRHHNGAQGNKELFEIMGSGVALLDYDNDGDLDIYFVNGAPLPSLAKQGAPYQNRLYRNEGGFRFTDVTEKAGVAGHRYGMGVAVGDYNNDGRPDLYVTNYGRNQLFKNLGNGAFRDVAQDAGVRASGWSTSAAFVDYDGDGLLDLYVCRYLDYEQKGEPICDGYCLPDLFAPKSDVLFRNNGDGTFEDVTRRSGIGAQVGNGLGVSVVDFDWDGWPDLLVANDRTQNFLYHNQHDGTFREIALRAGVGYSPDGIARAGMGVDAGDFDGDGRPDIVISNFVAEGLALFRNLGERRFRGVSGQTGVFEASYAHVGFGVKLFDYDNDGDLDILAVNGHVLDNPRQRKDFVSFAQPKLLLRNVNGEFLDVTGGVLRRSKVGRGAAFGDIDNDGDVDVVVNNNNGGADLLQNRFSDESQSLLLSLVGREGRSSAIGARVELQCCDSVRRIYGVQGAGSYLSHSDIRVYVGLAKHDAVEDLAVRWPSGKVDRVSRLRAGYVHTIGEGEGLLQSDRFD